MSGFRILRAGAGLGGLAVLMSVGGGWTDLVALAGAAVAALGLLFVAAGRLRPGSDALTGLGVLVGLSRLGGGWDEPSQMATGLAAAALVALAVGVPDEGMPRVRWTRAGPAWLGAAALVAGIAYWLRGAGSEPQVLVWDPRSAAGLSLRIALAVVLLAAAATVAWWARSRKVEAESPDGRAHEKQPPTPARP